MKDKFELLYIGSWIFELFNWGVFCLKICLDFGVELLRVIYCRILCLLYYSGWFFDNDVVIYSIGFYRVSLLLIILELII